MDNPAFDYEGSGVHYSAVRRADPRIAAQIHAALGDARTVLNVGAGSGNYEPGDRYVVPIEPSEAMRKQRPRHLAPALIGAADAIPFDDGAFDAAMAVLTVHHWKDRERCLGELRRVTRGPVVIMTFDPDAPTMFWMKDYAPELEEIERRRYGSLASITTPLGGRVRVVPLDVPRDCSDGFQVAFYARPEALLDARVRRYQSAWSFLAPGVEDRIVEHLAADLASGQWDARHGHLRALPAIKCQLRLVVATP
ncbi:MAG TPA: class I SAM-dependent methyltransferase [Polyangia bacterium]|nr:class I SAM-dependent methyltransferase [Polyangia bacterium]